MKKVGDELVDRLNHLGKCGYVMTNLVELIPLINPGGRQSYKIVLQVELENALFNQDLIKLKD